MQCVMLGIPRSIVSSFFDVVNETSRDCAGVDGWTDVDGNWQSDDVC